MKYENLFELAVREKYRYPYRGSISTEDLWDLSVASLDTVFKALNAQAKLSQEESLLQQRNKEDEVLDRKIEIVKYIVSVKQAEKLAAQVASEKKAQKQRIMEILASKEDAELQNKTADELRKMLESM